MTPARLSMVKPNDQFLSVLAQFGAIDIDSELVAMREQGPSEEQPELLVTLDNGCACCTVNENFVEILFKLVSASLASSTSAQVAVYSDRARSRAEFVGLHVFVLALYCCCTLCRALTAVQ